MNGVPELFQLLVHLHLCVSDALLRRVDSIGQHVTSAIDALRVHALLEFDTLGLQKAAEVLKEFVFFDGFHDSLSIVIPL